MNEETRAGLGQPKNKDNTSVKPLCIYHGNCPDGFGAAWAVRQSLGENVEFFPGFYGEPPPDVTDREVFLVDFSYKRDVLGELAEKAKKIIILDHHKSAGSDLMPLFESGRVSGLFDMEKSGAMLAWEFFHPQKEPPPLLRHIQDNDLWRFAMEGTKEIHLNLTSYPFDFAVWDRLMAVNINEMYADGKAIMRKHFRDVHALIKDRAYRMEICGYDVPVLNAPPFMASDAGNIMAMGEEFSVCYNDGPNRRYFSLRSERGGMDVAEIADVFGGGGHRNAAGFSMPIAQHPLLPGQTPQGR
ncbi:MAG: hypothetical protein H7836_07590 [Magnetococcus sp. YQC-3]